MGTVWCVTVAVVRACNDESTIGYVVDVLVSSLLFSEVIVAASGCTDATVGVAVSAGARVVEVGLGLGCVYRDVFGLVSDSFVLLDGDLFCIDVDVLAQFVFLVDSGVVVRGRFDTPGRSSSQLAGLAADAGVVLPSLCVSALTSAYQGFPKNFGKVMARFLAQVLPDVRGADLAVILGAAAAGYELGSVDVGPRLPNQSRGLDHIDSLVAANRLALENFRLFDDVVFSDWLAYKVG